MIKILLAAIILSSIFISNSYAQSTITISTDSNSYSSDSLVTITGRTNPPVANQIVAIEIKDGNNQSILLRTIQTDDNGAFELNFRTPPSATSGSYDIIATAVIDGDKVSQAKQITIGTMGTESPTPTTSGQKSGCLIATAAFGSELAPQVQILRETRDNIVMQTKSGASFMTSFNSVYYSFAPTVADWERENPVFKEIVKGIITPLITTLSILNYLDIDSEAEMLGYGIGVIALNVGMYFVAPAFVIMKIRKVI